MTWWINWFAKKKRLTINFAVQIQPLVTPWPPQISNPPSATDGVTKEVYSSIKSLLEWDWQSTFYIWRVSQGNQKLICQTAWVNLVLKRPWVLPPVLESQARHAQWNAESVASRHGIVAAEEAFLQCVRLVIFCMCVKVLVCATFWFFIFENCAVMEAWTTFCGWV